MYFTDSVELRAFEKDMKTVPFFGKREVWETASSCKKCANYKNDLKRCMKCHCPYLPRKFHENSVTTKKLIGIFLKDITYQPFRMRVKRALKDTTSNMYFLDEEHKERFIDGVSSVASYDYNQIASIYVLSMFKYIYENVAYSNGRYRFTTYQVNLKDYTLLEFANSLRKGNSRIDLRGISYCRKINTPEFICLCNAMLIKRFGSSVVKIGG